MGATEYNLPQRVLEDITVFAQKYNVDKIILFGSRAKGTHRERSDIDIAVLGGDFDGFYWDIKENAWTLLMFDIINLSERISDELQSEFIEDEYQAGTKDDFVKYKKRLMFDSGMMNGYCTIYVPESELPKGLLSYSSKPLSPVYFVKVYSGDVYEAFKKGDSAAKEWCPGHVYTGKAYTASRMKQHMTCQQKNEWYYSCKWCGKCEYNPNHTFSDEGTKFPVHDFARFCRVSVFKRNTGSYRFYVFGGIFVRNRKQILFFDVFFRRERVMRGFTVVCQND